MLGTPRTTPPPAAPIWDAHAGLLAAVRHPLAPRVELVLSAGRDSQTRRHTGDAYVFGLVLRGRCRVRRRIDGRADAYVAAPGVVTLLPPGHAVDVDVRGDYAYLQAVVPADLVDGGWRPLADDPGRGAAPGALAPGAAAHPDAAAALGALADLAGGAAGLAAGVAAGGPPGAARAEAALVAVQDLVRALAVAPLGAPPAAAGPALPPGLLADVGRRLGGPLLLRDLAAHAGLSELAFLRAFRARFGATPHRFIQRARLDRARLLLERSAASIADVAARTGFCDQAHLTTAFRRRFGATPNAWRRAHGAAAAPG